MKKLLFILLAIAVSNTAFATNKKNHQPKPDPAVTTASEFCSDCLSIKKPEFVLFKNYDGEPKSVTGSRSVGLSGSLWASDTVAITATYLGSESSYKDFFTLGGLKLTEANDIGDSITQTFSAGLVNFSFSDPYTTFSNGTDNGKYTGFVFLKGNKDYDFLIAFNDSAKVDADYDDFVVGINYVCNPTAVPEPDTYAMLLAGLGLMGFTASRRRKN
ncbi:MAG TPA: PEP-CTERM sorting domain-containing protein [Methylophilaceae bacterium]|nr:PEP-CTERM sorting domain-containing protein [Methylophilaceae bacterium]